jgi:hypothetical protein
MYLGAGVLHPCIASCMQRGLNTVHWKCQGEGHIVYIDLTRTAPNGQTLLPRSVQFSSEWVSIYLSLFRQVGSFPSLSFLVYFNIAASSFWHLPVLCQADALCTVLYRRTRSSWLFKLRYSTGQCSTVQDIKVMSVTTALPLYYMKSWFGLAELSD